MSNKSDNIVAFIIGAAVGAVAGILLAPDSGANTRKKIKDKMTDLRDKGSEKLDEVETRVREKTQHIKEEAGHRVDALKAAVNEGKAAYMREVGKQP